jgi:hypothetical protein
MKQPTLSNYGLDLPPKKDSFNISFQFELTLSVIFLINQHSQIFAYEGSITFHINHCKRTRKVFKVHLHWQKYPQWKSTLKKCKQWFE